MTLLGSLFFSSLCFGQFNFWQTYMESQNETSPYRQGYYPNGEAAEASVVPVGLGLGPLKTSLDTDDDKHFSLSINPNLGTTYQATGNSFLDQLSGRRDDRAEGRGYGFLYNDQDLYKYNFFKDKQQSSLFQFSDCTKTCDKNQPNCGWGPLSEKALKSRLYSCGMSMGDLTLEPVIIGKNGLVSCQSLAIENPSELNSLAQLIGYDCNIQRKDDENDASFCGCILKKAANPKEKLFSPLTDKEKSRIAALTQLDDFQRKTAEIQSSLFQVSKILGAASRDADTKHLFAGEGNESLACVPGSFDAIGMRFNTKQTDDKTLCGEQGAHRLNEFSRRAVLDCADSKKCSSQWRGLDHLKARLQKRKSHKKFNFFRFVQRQSLANHYGNSTKASNNKSASASEAVDESEGLSVDVITEARLLCDNGPQNEEEERRYLEECNQDVDDQGPKAALANLADVVSLVDAYRSGNYKSIEEFAAEIESDPQNAEQVAKVVKGMDEAHRVLKAGVFDTHSNQKTPFAKILSFVDDTIPEHIELNSEDASSLNEASGDLGEGFKTSKIQIAKQAIETCKSTLAELRVTCKEMDAKPEDMAKKPISLLDMTNFSPKGAAKRLQSQGKILGNDIHPISVDGLRRKFELYRCGNLMRDPNLSSLAFNSDSKLDGSVFREVFGVVSDPDLKEGLASNVDVSKQRHAIDPYAKDEKGNGFQHFLSNSGVTEMEKFGKAIGKANKKNSFTGNLKSVSDSTLGNTAALAAADTTGPTADSLSTLNNIADMAKNSLQTGDNTSSGDSASFNSEANYAKNLSGFNKDKLESEEAKVAQDKKAADERLDVIASRLADLMASKKRNDEARSLKEKTSDKDSLSSDPKYQEMLIEKLKLEKEIASLGIEKKRKLKAKKEFEQKLTAIETEKDYKAKQAQKTATASKAAPSKTKASTKGGSGSSGASRKIASVGGGGSSSASGGGSGVGFSSDANSAGSAPYVITLTQDQVTAIKQKFQVVENPNKWVSGGKPPVIREGNIFYELEVADGKIVVPFRKKPLNGFNVAGLRVPASDIEPLPMKIDKKDVKRRRAARVKELNAILDSK